MPQANSSRVLVLADAGQQASTSGSTSSNSSSLSTGSALEGFVQLPCPVTGTSCYAAATGAALCGPSCTAPAVPGQLQQYLVHGGLLQEVQRFKSTHSSWFIGNTVVSGKSRGHGRLQTPSAEACLCRNTLTLLLAL
jgi:hypothetical protein